MEESEITALMVETLEQGLSELRGQVVRLRSLKRESFEACSSFSIQTLLACLDDGESLAIFCKDLNPENQLDDAKFIRETGLDRSLREVRMYQKVLSAARLGTPELYGYRWEPDRDLYWLFIEDAGPARLSRVGDFEVWADAARWAARFHVTTRDMIPSDAQLFLSHDRAEFEACADRLEQNISKLPNEHRPSAERAVRLQRENVDRLCTLPRSLIHGEFFAQNVIFRPDRPDRRIAVIDWETAAIGPSYLDLAGISAGRWNPEQKRAMWRAYWREFGVNGGQMGEWSSFCDDMAVVVHYDAVRWIAWWSSGDIDQIEPWMRQLDSAMTSYRFMG